jgi:hypothetical protein
MNRFGSNSYENENDMYPQNIRIGKQLAENNPQPWNEAPNPAAHDYRHYNHPNYRPDHPVDYHRENQQRQSRYGSGENPVMPYYPADESIRHHDNTNLWTERNAYKDHDYRYRSGHRGYWHEDYDEKYEGMHHRRHPDSFFAHIGEGIREGWNNLMHRNPQQEEMERRRHEEERHEQRNRHWPFSEKSERDSRNQHMERKNLGAEWHNSGPEHRDEDFFNRDNFR